MRVLLEKRKIHLKPKHLLGQGGEAEVYDLGGDEALKLFKRPDHPDFASFPEQVQAARARIDEMERKIPAFPWIDPRVVAPQSIARDPKSGRLLGYSMQRVDDAEALLRLSDRTFREANDVGVKTLVAIFRELTDAVSAVHRAGVVLGDFNDLNVLLTDLDGVPRVHLIDADSFQYGGFPCRVFTERFVDPRHCAASAPSPTLAREHDEASDWYALHVMLIRSFLSVDPYGGIHKPPRGTKKIPPGRRALERISVFHGDVRYPKPALPRETLPDEWLDHLLQVFHDDERGPFPSDLLEAPDWRRCRVCGMEHARRACPSCRRALAMAPLPTNVRGKIEAVLIGRAETPSRINWRAFEAPTRKRFRIEDGRLLRKGRFGDEHVGDVVEGRTRFWVGERFGVGFTQAGELQIGFVFDVERGRLNDQVDWPRFPGRLLDLSCTFHGDRAWLRASTLEGGREIVHFVVLRCDGSVEAHDAGPADREWRLGAAGVCAVEGGLLVPSDEGILAIKVLSGALVEATSFPDAEPWIDAESRLFADEDSILVVRGTAVRRLRFLGSA